MKKAIAITISVFSLTVGCTDNSNKYNDTYTILRSGVMYPDETFDVIHVYGFSDNRLVAHEIADFLNKEEPNTYEIRPAD